MLMGSQVRLRPIRRDDLPQLRVWFDDPELMRHWGRPAPLVPDEAFEADLRGRFSRFDAAGYFMVEHPDGHAIGRIDFERLEMQSRSAEAMILIGDLAGQGQGYGTDAMVTLLRYLFHQRNLHRVSLTVLSWNARAIRSYEKVGFVVEGTLRDDQFFDGRYHDQIAMSIHRAEFDARWPSGSAAST